MDYMNIKTISYHSGGGISCTLTRPIPCDLGYFIDAFWMPIKKQIGKKLVFIPARSRLQFTLYYNPIATIGDVEMPSDEQREFCEQDSQKVTRHALEHVDRVLTYMYGEGEIKFIDEMSPIKSVIDETITLNGRLPMQEAYFIKKYWEPIAKHYHTTYKGIRFRIHFSKLGDKLSITAELCKDNAIRMRRGLPKQNNQAVAAPILQRLLSDVEDAVIMAAAEYATAKK